MPELAQFPGALPMKLHRGPPDAAAALGGGGGRSCGGGSGGPSGSAAGSPRCAAPANAAHAAPPGSLRQRPPGAGAAAAAAADATAPATASSAGPGSSAAKPASTAAAATVAAAAWGEEAGQHVLNSPAMFVLRARLAAGLGDGLTLYATVAGDWTLQLADHETGHMVRVRLAAGVPGVKEALLASNPCSAKKLC
eukprot:350327-Chlamydomonas_euryale.AAC.1